jgi:hypothetical protein
VRGEAGKSIGIAVSLLCVGAVVAVLGPRFFRLSGDAEAEVITALKATERDGLQLTVPGVPTPLVSQQVRFDRISVSMNFEEGTATAVATLDFRGKLGGVEVSSLGLERVRFRYKDHDWVPEAGGMAPTLTRIVRALEARRQAIDAGDVGRLRALWAGEQGQELLPADRELRAVLQLAPREYRVRAWYIRSERDEVLVAEDFRLTGHLPDKPIDEVGTRRLSLKPRGVEFLFWPSLM